MTRTQLFAIDAAASVLTIAGIQLGSTTLAGCLCYLGGLVFWFVLTFARRAWGLMPLNIATTLVIGRTLYGLLA